MPWVRFLSDFDFRATAAVTIAYKEGMVRSVTTRCANAAISQKKAAKVPTPRREVANGKT